MRQLARRLGFVVLGVLMLVVLSEISKLDLHQYLQPPRVSDSSILRKLLGCNRVPNMMCLTSYALALVLVACVKVRKAK